jgi:agmatine deiminase
MPAEWEPMESIWLAWPHDPVTWPNRLAEVQRIYEGILSALTPTTIVDLLVDPGEEEQSVRARVHALSLANVRLHPVPHVDSWIRDYGPTFLVRGRAAPLLRSASAQSPLPTERAHVSWIFNAWGGKYETLWQDDRVTGRLEDFLDEPAFYPGIVLEGGSVDVNGAGCVLTTEQCLLNANRNPTLDRPALETILRGYLGVEKVLWLREGIQGDDTDGHVDDVARFAGPRTILLAAEEDRTHPNFEPLRENRARAEAMRDASGNPFALVDVPMPADVRDEEGVPLPASYLNFLVANQVVLVPVFGQPTDARALGVLAKVFPQRRLVPVPAKDLFLGRGTVHCLSQQMPAVARDGDLHAGSARSPGR